MPIPPLEELRPFEGFASFIEHVCDDYPNVKTDNLITYFYFWHRQGENGGILGELFHQRDRRTLHEAKDFMFLLMADITREKCGETPTLRIDSPRFQIAREHAAKLRSIVQDFSIKY